MGPRPTVQEQVDRYTDRQRRRLEVKPGITGWAQVNGRTSLPWPERIELDVWYVEHRSLRWTCASWPAPPACWRPATASTRTMAARVAGLARWRSARTPAAAVQPVATARRVGAARAERRGATIVA